MTVRNYRDEIVIRVSTGGHAYRFFWRPDYTSKATQIDVEQGDYDDFGDYEVNYSSSKTCIVTLYVGDALPRGEKCVVNAYDIDAEEFEGAQYFYTHPGDFSFNIRKNKTVPVKQVGNHYEAAYLTASKWNAFVDFLEALLHYASRQNWDVSLSSWYVQKGEPMQVVSPNSAFQLARYMFDGVSVPNDFIAGQTKLVASVLEDFASSLSDYDEEGEVL